MFWIGINPMIGINRKNRYARILLRINESHLRVFPFFFFFFFVFFFFFFFFFFFL